MSGRSHPLAWVPPLLVGAAAGVAAEVAVGILLYAGPGMMRSLTTILAVEGVALGGGLWSAPRPRPGLVDRLRRRWVICLAAFLVAAVFGTAWSVVEELGGGPLGQGVGLALLAAFPLFTCGAVLGGMASVGASDPAGGGRGTGASAALGAAAGFVVTGVLLPRAPIPASLLVACLVLVSAAGMVYGSVLGRRLEVHVRAARPSQGGEVRVEDRRQGGVDPPARYLLEGDHVRRCDALHENGAGVVPWEVAVARAVIPLADGPGKVLMLGGGASALPSTLRGERPFATIDILERTGAVVELARDHFGTGLTSFPEEHVSVRIGNLEDLLADLPGPYDLVLVDTAALAPMGGVAALSRAARARLMAAVSADGSIAWGPVPPEPGTPTLPEGWVQTVFRRSNTPQSESFVLVRPPGAGWPERAADFVPAPAGRVVR